MEYNNKKWILIGEGLPIVEGKAEGYARVIKKHFQNEQYQGGFQAGEILISRSTIPEWEPLFSIASGIATEYGGFGSHAAQVAPMYKKPCVIGIENLINNISTGDYLLVDGDNGRVYKSEK